MKPKLLIIGGSGFLGSTLTEYILSDYEIHVTFNKNPIQNSNIQSTQIDLLTDREKIIDLIKSFQPDIVVHTVAHSSVDLCETNNKIADELHVDVTQDIANICSKINSKLIYISSDFVFEGQLNKKYTEEDKPNPINYYGKTKLEAEKIILESNPKNTILRTAVIYGWHKKSRFTNWILESLSEKKIVDPFIDQYNTPTLVDDLAKSIHLIISLKISGLYHATGKTCVNRYEFAVELANSFGYDKNLIKPVTSLEKKQGASRPTSTCLDSRKLENMTNYKFLKIEDGISFILKKSKENIL
jgi:dTDP-4-dehydrorhamnose reductase